MTDWCVVSGRKADPFDPAESVVCRRDRPEAADPGGALQAPAQSAADGRLAELEAKRQKVARLIAEGEEWILPIFLRRPRSRPWRPAKHTLTVPDGWRK